MKILLTSAEMTPFTARSRTGEAVSALATSLSSRGHQVTIMMPKFGSLDLGNIEWRRKRIRLTITIKGKAIQGGVMDATLPSGATVTLFEQPTYFDRKGIFGADGKDFTDNDERFTFFCRAVMETCRLSNYAPDVIHCFDWPSGAVPLLLQTEYRDYPELNTTGTVFTLIHLRDKGLFPPETMMTLGLSWSLFTPSMVEHYGDVSFLKAGVAFTDKITTPSQRYAKSIRTSKYGMGFEELLQERAADLKGVLHGADHHGMDPMTDPFISSHFGPQNPKGKELCKADLQSRAGFSAHPHIPVIVCLSELTREQGVHLWLGNRDELLSDNCQWIFFGQGNPKIQEDLAAIAKEHPTRLALREPADEEWIRRALAGADFFWRSPLDESFDPLTLTAMRYGAVPIVNAVGSLDDVVENVTEGEGTGFKFEDTYGPGLVESFRKALELYGKKPQWTKLLESLMSQDFSWERPTRQYEALYQEVMEMRAGKQPARGASSAPVKPQPPAPQAG